MDCFGKSNCFGILQMLDSRELEDPDGMTQSKVVVGLHGGPYDRPSWEPESTAELMDSAGQQPWELSAIIYDVCFLIVLSALAVGQLTLLCRGISRCIDYLSKRFFLGNKMAEMAVDDWNKIHIAQYTPSHVEYLKGGSEDYELHVEDYRELLRILTFVDEQSFT
ncbi:hypothetical protein D915_007198 [Fasciola hepatica]|uniref:Uncharacterized protein n=1 Tax=Fasciola hepatica TaxID=6192 RepID=A0A4E0RZ19_FASHE|nr:hypothetical protein D915_007198 [Fasciola hepatica]